MNASNQNVNPKPDKNKMSFKQWSKAFNKWAKENIDISVYAHSVLGYKLLREKGTGAWLTLKHEESGDKIITTKTRNYGHYMYKGAGTDEKLQDIFSFVQDRLGLTYAQALQKVYEFDESSIDTETMKDYATKSKKEYNYKDINSEWLQGKTLGQKISAGKYRADLPIDSFEILEYRGIPKNIYEQFDIRLISKKIEVKNTEGNVARTMTKHNMAIPAYKLTKDAKESGKLDTMLTGWSDYYFHHSEVKADGMKKVVKHCTYDDGMWTHRPFGPKEKIKGIFVSESPIDSMSYLAKKEIENNNFDRSSILLMASFGQPSQAAIEVLVAAYHNIPQAKIVFGMDNDEGGTKIANQCIRAVALSIDPGIIIEKDDGGFVYNVKHPQFEAMYKRFSRAKPEGKDFNDDLLEALKLKKKDESSMTVLDINEQMQEAISADEVVDFMSKMTKQGADTDKRTVLRPTKEVTDEIVVGR